MLRTLHHPGWTGRAGLAQGKGQFDIDEDRDRLALTRTGTEAPSLHGFDRFLVETEAIIQRAHDLHLADRAVLHHDRFHFDDPLDLGAHRAGGVERLLLVEHNRRLDTV